LCHNFDCLIVSPKDTLLFRRRQLFGDLFLNLFLV